MGDYEQSRMKWVANHKYLDTRQPPLTKFASLEVARPSTALGSKGYIAWGVDL